MKRDPSLNHKIMASIKGKDTKIELALRKELTKLGIRYRKNYKNLIGKPDIYIPSSNLAIFADSEFWHGYNFEEAKKSLKTNASFWIKKIERNIARDKEVNKALEAMGVTVLRFYGFEIEKNMNGVMEKIISMHQERLKICSRKKSIKIKTTLGYALFGDSILFLRRNKKKDDPNEGKCVGIGGHFEKNENRYSCMRREFEEETSLKIKDYSFLGTIYFLNDTYEDEKMYLFEIRSFSGNLKGSCEEGEFVFAKKEEMLKLPLWEGDKYFLKFIGSTLSSPFELTLIYKGEKIEKVEGPYFK